MSTTSQASIARDIATALGPGGWLDVDDIADRLVDFRKVFHGSALGAARPATTDEVASVVRICIAHDVAIVSQGGNTGLSGGAIPTGDRPTVIMSLERMTAVEDVNPRRSTITAQAGVTISELQDRAAAVDRLFAPDWGARGSATLGGAISTNAGGINVLRYGTMREQILGIEVVLPDGRIWNGLRALPKDNSGFDLKHLFIGGEGTIGIVTRAVVKLHPRPAEHRTAFVALSSIDALAKLFAMTSARAPAALSAFELVPDIGIEQVVDRYDVTRPIDAISEWYVLLRFSGARGVGDELLGLLADAADAGLLIDGVVAESAAQEDNLWMLRDELTATRAFGGFGVKYDLAVPPDRIAAFLADAGAAASAVLPGVLPYAFGHVGDGNLHFTVLHPAGDDRELEAVAAAMRSAIDAVVWRFDGTISAEHGLGRELPSRISGQKPAVELELMRKVKQLFDPDDRCNPGVMLAPD